ncbi:MAG: hypothetical protein JWN44_3813 [Myxococcales bacterium]|nr:hypothetical protein [Myxococcales bacterium]
MRPLAVLLTVVCTAAVSCPARADERRPGPDLAPPADPPRWRLRGMLAQGFGGGRDADGTVLRFPTTLELGARIWGPISVDAGVTGTLASEYATACGQPVRPNAVASSVGLRADLANGRSASWIDPWVEVHGGVGTQAGAREVPGGCPVALTFGTAGARAGFDAWLGRGAVTVALTFDYLPIGSTVSFVLGSSLVLF